MMACVPVIIERHLATNQNGMVTTFERHHATLFVEGPTRERIESLRLRWDPVMASQIAAHVTLIYPWEAPDADLMIRRVAAAGARHRPFRLRVDELHHEGTTPNGVWFSVADIDDGYAELRDVILVPPFSAGDVPAHVTIVHPRTSTRGGDAWRALGEMTIASEFWIDSIAITAWDGRTWPTIEATPLGGSSPA
jgi:hypothetical protein